MWQFEGKNVLTGDCVLIWDGITQPEDAPDGSGQKVYNVKVAIPDTAPELQELYQLAMTTLQNSEFKGNLPPGANWPLQPVDTTKQGMEPLAGHQTFNAKTRQLPEIYDANGQPLSPMSYGRMLYAGAKMRLLVHCYAYNKVQKGIAYGLDGLMIVDASAPALAVGGGPSRDQIAQAMGAVAGGQPQAPAPSQPAPAAAPAGGQPQAPGAPAPAGGQPQAPAPSQPAPAAAPPANYAPAPDFANPAGAPAPSQPAPAGPKMTAAAGEFTYDQYRAAGWTDEQLRAHGLME